VEIGRIGEAVAATGVLNPATVEITDLAYDTRSVVPGALFFCVRGGQVDRHELAAEAVARGAVALVVEHEVDAPVPQIVVPDARHAMAPAAVAFFGDPSREVDVVAVTGTAGKTTTAYLLDSILRAAGRRPGPVSYTHQTLPTKA
jgi:UDP-N-acetylmuramoyl-L-alanyl-D-glutamate--2,6-diaminopimelate ligase